MSATPSLPSPRRENQARDLLRFMTAGSVDDGKSTLIGRLLYESDGVYEDQLAGVRKASAAKNLELDLSLVTDGLRAEREQGITIDVAYRYFSTPKRKFIIADVPGHEQYTRNMATGASTAELVLLLIDARRGVLRQTRRHALIAWMMGIRETIVAVNKMDLVGFDPAIFAAICDDFNRLAATFPQPGKRPHVQFVPVCALEGENVTRPNRDHPSPMPWYAGPTVLELLESAPAEPFSGEAFRFPVQNVIRPHQDFRGYAGQVVTGMAAVGTEVIALPSWKRTRIRSIQLFDRQLEQAGPMRSVVLSLADHIDLGRGDMLAGIDSPPMVSTQVTAHLIWMDSEPLRVNHQYLIKHTTQTLCGRVVRIKHQVDIHTFEPVRAETLQLNEIGMVELELHTPIYCDLYVQNRGTGNFIIIDPFSNHTVAAGMIAQATPQSAGSPAGDFFPSLREGGLTIWFTGLSGAGKTTICRAVETELLARGLPVEVIDGDVIRKHLCKDLGFSRDDRNENIRRIAFVAQLLTRNGTIVLVSAISPYREARDAARRAIGSFVEVFVNAPLDICEVRDPKELYRRAREGTIKRFTGIDDPYEPPLNPEIICDTARESIHESAAKVTGFVQQCLSAKHSAANESAARD